MGVVYAAHDTDRDVEVALKTLREPDADALYRFKREFRALADVHHPNLVALYELIAEDDRWFFTMELLEGVDFVTHVRGVRRRAMPSEAPTFAVGPRTPTPGPEPAPIAPPSSGDGATADIDALRQALEQLVDGVCALHESGHLHRDIKPSNVLVTHDGRVVLLDFGVVAELGRRRGSKREVVGTPAYMAPEQALGGRIGPASDWYSVGVLLYEALTGRRPFGGGTSRVLSDKVLSVAPPPSLAWGEAPPDLDALCQDLLRRNPAERPTGAAVVERLRDPASVPAAPPPADAEAPGVELYGRREPLDMLHHAFARTRAGAAEMVLVEGASGTGKTALVRHFLDRLEELGTLVVAGRCYQRESVPFKALDPIVDELCAWMLDLDVEELAALLPDDALLLARVFPVLRRLPPIGEAPDEVVAEPQDVRRRAFAALRALLDRVARQRALVIFVDDLQWTDDESLSLLEELLRAPDPPAVLWLGSVRADDDRISILDALGRRVAIPGAARRTRLLVEPLDMRRATALASATLSRVGGDPKLAPTIAAEAGGNPFFVLEMARTAARATGRRGAPMQLDALIRERVDALPDGDRRLVEVVALAGRPVPQDAAFAAAELGGPDRPVALKRLVAAQLLQPAVGREADAVECWHDRIREAVVDGLAPKARAAIHRRLAETLEARGGDPETLAEHWFGAGEPARAAGFAERAADAAAETLSFERAATLYRFALDAGAPDPDRARALRRRLGEALSLAGRGLEAGAVFEDAATEATDPDDALEMRRRAAEEFMRSGRVARGLPHLREVLRAVGLRLPRTSAGAIGSLLTQRGLLKLRGLRFDARGPEAVDDRARRVADACYAACTGLAQVEPLISSAFSTRAVRAALKSGDATRAARCILLESILISTGGVKARAETERYLDRGEALARELGDPLLTGFAQAARGVAAFELGEFGRAHALCEDGIDRLEGGAAGAWWELGTVQLFSALAALFSAHLRDVAKVLPRRLADAEHRGDLYTATCLRAAITPVIALLGDDPESGRREVDEAIALWGRDGHFDNQHLMAFIAGTFCDLYARDFEAGLARCDATDPPMERSLLTHVQLIRAAWRLTRSLCRVQAAAAGIDTERLAKSVRADAKRLNKEGPRWCDAAAAMLRAGLAAIDGDREGAIRELETACAGFLEAEMGLFEIACRWRRGALIAGDDGATTIVAALEELRAEGVQQPERWVVVFAPPGVS